MSLRLEPHQINPLNADGDPVADGEYVLTVAGGKVTGFNTAPTGGGGGAATVRDRRWLPGPAETSLDEFNDDTIAAAWSRVDSAGESSFCTWLEEADILAATTTGGDAAAELHALVRPLSGVGGAMVAGDAFETCMNMPVGSGNVFSGLILADGNTAGAGNQLAVTRHTSGQVYFRQWSNYNNNTSSTLAFTSTAPIYVRIVWLGGTSWRFENSSDGVIWYTAATTTMTLTPTHVGFLASSWGSGAGGRSYEFLRRVAGIT